ncbi:nucleoporin GLE1-like, partial [Agrilus planipennis]
VGGTEVIASKHPEGIAFCMDLLAKKFVLQGDLMISSNPEAAFCYATIILSLWNQFPEFGKLFLLHLHKECIYLIPFYPPRLADQTDEDYYKSLGYNYIDGVVEKQDKFLKRMMGIMRLYAAIVISKPKSDQKISPHNIAYGWRWFSAFLNLEPQIDITATMIHIFLEVAGSTLQQVYGKQFYKLMNFLSKVYMPMLKKYDSGGPFTRLEVLLHDYQRTGQLEKPKGLLPTNFW